MKPSLLNPAFRYTPAASTDIRVLFKRVRKQLAQEAKPQNVEPFKPRARAK